MGTTATAQRVVLGEVRSSRRALFADTYHPCLGSGRGLPYSADRGKKSVSRQALDELNQQIRLLYYRHHTLAYGCSAPMKLSPSLEDFQALSRDRGPQPGHHRRL